MININYLSYEEFLELGNGTIFEFCGNIYIKVSMFTYIGTKNNSVNLRDGIPCYIDPHESVVPYENSELILRQ